MFCLGFFYSLLMSICFFAFLTRKKSDSKRQRGIRDRKRKKEGEKDRSVGRKNREGEGDEKRKCS